MEAVVLAALINAAALVTVTVINQLWGGTTHRKGAKRRKRKRS